MRTLAVGAHPDDIEFLCAGTLALCAKRGDEVFIAIVTDGGCGSPTLSRKEIAKVRFKEAKKAAKIIGVKLTWMNFADGYFFEKEEYRDRFVDLIWMKDQYGMSITESMEVSARYRGIQCGVKYAEGFRQLRAYPRANTKRLLP
ncbi:MAG: PIG-L family deacetylase [Candidatus Omnitrophota bacterium]